ncbi:solute carrier family 26 member 10 isoform X1 [Harpegnathos saltator]|nr:solute carrier family 26 member 10 isoform X1 [Harpegnathos saltator]
MHLVCDSPIGISRDGIRSISEEDLLRCSTVNKEDYLSDDMSTNGPELTVRRPVYQQDELNHLYKYVKPKRILSKEVSRRCKKIKPVALLKKSIPLIDWISSYNWKDNILGDIVAGITVAVMHVPQGMAYAILGNVPPIVGMYMAFFPVLVYFLLGTSRHNSMGTFALVCMMTGKVVTTYSSAAVSMNNTSVENGILISNISRQYSPIEVATAVTFTVAIIQLGMYVLRLGVISSLLADSLVSGFTTAAAMHVFTSQIKDLLGLNKLPRRGGAFKLILTYVDIFNNLDNVNITAVILSSITIMALIFNNEILKPKVAKFCPFPVPIEMLAVVIGTLVSMQMNLSDTYNVLTVGNIPVGLPIPSVPPLSLIPNILVDSFVITMVAYTISMSMALIFAQKIGYEVDSNQELIAQGLGNLIGSFFSCMPITASLSRSLIQQTVGGHTQLASLISCGLLVSVLLWIGPFFQPLPRCVLASIIVVALKGMLMKVTDFMKFWRLDKIDAGIWAVTFIIVILFDVEYGLFIGVLLCIGRLLVLAMRPYTCKLALVPDTELYLDAKRYKGTVEIPGIKIFRYSGSLNFACRQYFREEIYKIAELMPQKELYRRLKAATTGSVETEEIKKLRVLILDFTALSHVDLAGANAIRNIIEEYCSIEVSVYIAGCSGPVYETMRKCNLTNEYNDSPFFAMFPTVADAVHFARSHSEVPSTPATWSTRVYDENYISRL